MAILVFAPRENPPRRRHIRMSGASPAKRPALLLRALSHRNLAANLALFASRQPLREILMICRQSIYYWEVPLGVFYGLAGLWTTESAYFGHACTTHSKLSTLFYFSSTFSVIQARWHINVHTRENILTNEWIEIEDGTR